MTKKFLLIAIIALVSPAALAQASDFKKLDRVFQLLEDNDKFMGSIAISHQGNSIYSNTIGYSDIASEQKADSQTKYRIGSISKMFTAVLIFKAIEEKQLSLKQSIEAFFPKIKNAPKITIGNLLNHSSGIHDFTRNDDYFSWNTESRTKEEMTALISGSKAEFLPGEKGEYSNSNYYLLSLILEETYQKPYQVLLKEKIVAPLNLNSTYYGEKIDPATNESHSYTFLGAWEKEEQTDPSIPLGAGGIVSTPTDLTRFANHLFNGQIISEESLEQMKQIKNGHGMGLFTFPFYEKISYGHPGGIDGFVALLEYFPEDELAVALTSNGLNYDFNVVLLAALNSFYGRDYEVPVFQDIEVDEKALTKYTGTYSSEEIPPKITIAISNNTLTAQATGQSAFPLEATAANTFSFDKAGVVIEFIPEENQLIMKQGGKEFLFTKEPEASAPISTKLE